MCTIYRSVISQSFSCSVVSDYLWPHGLQVSSAYLRLLIFLPTILIPACVSYSLAFHMIYYSACKLNKQGDNIQPWHIPFCIWNQSVVPCPVLTVASWPVQILTYRFLRRQVRWSEIPISLRIFHSLLVHTVKGFGVVNKAEIDVFFLELSCFFDDPMDVSNLISFLNPPRTSGSSQFTYYWSLAWRILSITLLACEMSAIVQYFEHSLALPFLGIGMKADLFQSCWPLLNFPNLLAYWVQYFHSIIFQDLI